MPPLAGAPLPERAPQSPLSSHLLPLERSAPPSCSQLSACLQKEVPLTGPADMQRTAKASVSTEERPAAPDSDRHGPGSATQPCKTLSQTLHLAKPGSHVNKIGRSFYLGVMDNERCPPYIK